MESSPDLACTTVEIKASNSSAALYLLASAECCIKSVSALYR